MVARGRSVTYRDAILTPPVEPETPPLWQRLLFRIDRTAAAERWQWARQAIGGRWSYAPVEYLVLEWRWQRFQSCPAQHVNNDYFYREVEDADSVLECFGECSRRRCVCEVYP